MKVMLLVGLLGVEKLSWHFKCAKTSVVFFMMSDHQVLKVSWNILIQMLM